jgi:hypothetical protein
VLAASVSGRSFGAAVARLASIGQPTTTDGTRYLALRPRERFEGRLAATRPDAFALLRFSPTSARPAGTSA